MSVEIVASALLVLSGLTWLGTGLLNFSESQRQFCDLYCSLTDLLPKEFVNVLFVLLGVLALGFGAMIIYKEYSKNKVDVEKPKIEEKITSLNVAEKIETPVVEMMENDSDGDGEATEKIDFSTKEKSSTRHFKTSCCGK